MPDMDEEEARRRFVAARVARLATVDAEGRPHLVPLVFAARGGELVTAVDHKPKRSQRLRRLRNIAAHPAVCLLVDAYDEDWDRLWWVRADGDARVLPPGTPGEYPAAIALLRDKYAPYRRRPPDGPVIAVTIHRWQGWRASPQPYPES
ncbi:TIGR03668 family PPOX class F420-dependent oxidoreductase [Streptomyces sp. NBC_01450]|uniref:TIGR03668 family PPOX class F420-dependent oxidoreductase n=1 Tax=Streptomyces sp. NBC_01450 TaxID=2903871 RepID=UPI002E30EAF7|nr:TIGR03668 family PPOX class F420-dependent oxidoreductase [Streptomyces sp. NBC_01450]